MNIEKTLFVQGIQAGDKIRGVFLVTEKNLAVSQKGNPYLSLKLRDRSGDIEARVWEDALAVSEGFKKGDLVSVQGRAVNFRDVLQLSLYECDPVTDANLNPADFSPASRHDVEGMFAELAAIMDTVENPHLGALLRRIFDNPETTHAFKHAPAAKGFHHAYIGGLLEHTLSVTRLMIAVSGHYEDLNRDLLITGCILHDIGKITELSYSTMIDYTDEGRLVGHIVLGVEMADRVIRELEGFPEHLALELRHILLSHHGLLEYGSPKRPKTREALLINFIDDLDAKMNAFETHMAGGDDDSPWTNYHRLLDRFLYRGPKPDGTP
ncbi:MAG: HD domain-containing protein [Syntrophales bacterium]|nr:HD domain-containing protein [Syntrophales bacterium]MCK9528604.1 HD domain-containing protein [Syntrophales bacterium]MDX9923045.1 HD domain-containing protein [Syntrophales bacterium]